MVGMAIGLLICCKKSFQNGKLSGNDFLKHIEA
jgi:hypothetical protein